eukprot:GEMP01004398.1.p1 GENE.GEMP01004398.1~~GEMP01004398.1.p1  ORF type:complete len:300 (+),score=59.47 GEMP01004398.1:3291-4190(+)
MLERLLALLGENPVVTGLVGSVGVVSGLWPFLGGAPLSFALLRPLLFGRSLHTLEYPSGLVHTVLVRWVTIPGMKRAISRRHSIPVQDVKHLNVWIDKYFTEPVDNQFVVQYLSHSSADGSWIIWSKEEENTIPTKGLTLESLGTDNERVNKIRVTKLIDFCLQFENPAQKDMKIGEDDLEELLSLCAKLDPILLALFRVYERNPKTFRQLALLRLHFKDESRIDAVAHFIVHVNNLHISTWASQRTAQAHSIAWILKNSDSPLQLFERFQLNERLFVKFLQNFLHKKGNPFEEDKKDF